MSTCNMWTGIFMGMPFGENTICHTFLSKIDQQSITQTWVSVLLLMTIVCKAQTQNCFWLARVSLGKWHTAGPHHQVQRHLNHSGSLFHTKNPQPKSRRHWASPIIPYGSPFLHLKGCLGAVRSPPNTLIPWHSLASSLFLVKMFLK